MSADDLKSSANVWGSDLPARVTTAAPSQPSRSHSTPSDEPPSYTNAVDEAPPTPRRHLNPIEEISLLSAINFSNYDITASTASDDHSSLTSTHPLFYTSPTALSNLLSQQSILPPRPQVHIKGTHSNSSRITQTDFEFTLNLVTLLDIPQRPPTSPRLRLSQLPPDHQPRRNTLLKRSSTSNHPPPPPHPLDTWCKIFTSDKSENKSLTLTRLILDSPTSHLEGAIRTLMHTLKYRGKLEVSFPTQNQSVIIHKAPGNWFYNMLGLYPVKEYKVAVSAWEIRGANDGSSQKVVEEWWEEWKGVVANAVLRKHQGRVGVEEWMEWKMGLREKEKKAEWGVDG